MLPLGERHLPLLGSRLSGLCGRPSKRYILVRSELRKLVSPFGVPLRVAIDGGGNGDDDKTNNDNDGGNDNNNDIPFF
jgi:hypothetical protein